MQAIHNPSHDALQRPAPSARRQHADHRRGFLLSTPASKETRDNPFFPSRRRLARTVVALAARLFCLLWMSCALLQNASAESSYLDSWTVHPAFKGPVPKPSDVIFSTRFKRDDAATVARSFGATRIEWVYSSDPEYIEALRNIAPWFGGAVSSTIPMKDDRGIARDLEGKPIVAPWMHSWGAKWITVADESARSELTELAAAYIRAGANSIQVDDPLLQFGARWWGADFSESSVRGFREFLLSDADPVEVRAAHLDRHDLDYRTFLATQYGIATAEEYAQRQKQLPSTPLWHAYLRDSVLKHFAAFRKALDSLAGKHVPLSMNLRLFGPDERRDQFALLPFVDYAMVETRIDDYDILTLQAATYRALGIGFAPSIIPTTRDDNRRAIRDLYALGAQPLVPWDVFINHGPETPPSRFFGSAADYADLYLFVRRNATIFDDYENLPVVGILAPTANYKLQLTLALVRRLNAANVPFALVPTGAAYPLDPTRLRHLRLLVTVNPFSDIDAQALRAIEKSAVTIVPSALLSENLLPPLSPLASTATDLEHVGFRGNTSGNPTLALHLLPSALGPQVKSAQLCEKEISLRSNFFHGKQLSAVTVYTPASKATSTFTQTPAVLSFKVPMCDSWAIALLYFSE